VKAGVFWATNSKGNKLNPTSSKGILGILWRLGVQAWKQRGAGNKPSPTSCRGTLGIGDNGRCRLECVGGAASHPTNPLGLMTHAWYCEGHGLPQDTGGGDLLRYCDDRRRDDDGQRCLRRRWGKAARTGEVFPPLFWAAGRG